VAAGTLSLLICGLISNVGLRLRAPTVDAALARMDDIVGWDVSVAVPAFTAHPWMIDSLAFTYNLSGPLAVGSIVVTLLAGQLGKAWELFNTTVLTMQVIAAISIIAPARGAMAHFDLLYLQGNGLPRGAGIYHLAAFDHLHVGTEPHFGLADMSGLVTFPSFHTVLGLLLAQALAETRLAWLGVAASAAVIVSTIPIGGHYVSDILAGTLIWLIAAIIARRINGPSDRYYRTPSPKSA
jgi:membrane-associated phospholipid phosphatase